jgi:hypothetical protein
VRDNVERPLRETEITIPATHEVYVAQVATTGRFREDRWPNIEADIEMRVRRRRNPARRRDPEELIRAESLPLSLAYALALAVAAPVEIPISAIRNVDWRVTKISIYNDSFDGLCVELTFESTAAVLSTEAKIYWHIKDWTAPLWFADAIRDFVGPMFSRRGLTDVSST